MSDMLRMLGMNSGMDTESVVKALVSGKKTNVDKAKKAKQKLEWQQDAWKEMNSKIYSLYAGAASKMRFASAYSKKVTKSSNSALSVLAGDTAALGVQTAKINSIAKAGYLTGAELGNDVTNDTLVKDLGIDVGSKFSITSNGKTEEIEITEDMKISDVTAALKKVGVNANFDSANKRFFVSSSSTGLKNDFSFEFEGSEGENALRKLGLLEEEGGATKVKAEDAELVLNGVTFKSDSNTFNINGSTYTVSAKTSEEISITTENDTSGTYNAIKDFFKQYNELMTSMSKAYNADSAKGYDPLSDDEKEALTDKQVEEWEKKAKDALLRKDSTLGDMMSTMKAAMSTGIDIGGKTYYLADFGITTQGYFEADVNERYAYHIAGDPDDTVSGSKDDVLKGLIASDPKLVEDFFSQLSNKLYNDMYSKMGSTDYSSIYKVYNDKQMKKEYSDYEKKIADLEQKLSDAEDRYYKKFSKMETALSKLNSTQSALSGLFNM